MLYPNALSKYDAQLTVCTLKQIPIPAEFNDNSTFLSKFGLEMELKPMPEVVGSVLELSLVVLAERHSTEHAAVIE